MRQDQPVPTRRFSFLFTTFFPFPTRCLFSILRFLSLLHLPQLFFPSLLLFFCRCQRQPDIFPSPPLSPTSPNLGFSTAYRLPHVSPSRRGAFVSRERSPPQRRRHTWPQSVRLSVVLSAGVWGRGPARRLLLGWHTVTCCLVGGNFQ